VYLYTIVVLGRIMRHKLVNLCEESFQIASSHKNFSKWLRITLLKDANVGEKLYEYECQKCYNITIHPRDPVKGVRRMLFEACKDCKDSFSDIIAVIE
jgi:predicted SprT family Zn-dependent metalloprotease